MSFFSILILPVAPLFCLQDQTVVTGVPVRAHYGYNEFCQLGHSSDLVGDVDGDGFDDYVIGSLGALHPNGLSRPGAGELRSGKDGQRLDIVFGPHDGAYGGRSVAGIGDIDQDGTLDWAVGNIRDSTFFPFGGSVTAMSGKTKRKLGVWYGRGADDKFGRDIAKFVDRTGDGLPEVLIGAYQPVAFHGLGPGYVDVVSAAQQGASQGTIYGTIPGDMFGVSLNVVGDVNGDGVPEYAVGAFYGTPLAPGATSVGSVTMVDGATDQALWLKYATHFWFGYSGVRNPTFGRIVCPAGDVDGDGVADVLVSAPLWEQSSEHEDTNRGLVCLLSGVDGSLMKTYRGDAPGSNLGQAMVNLGDLDSDGVDDYAIGGAGKGQVVILSGATFRPIGRLRHRKNIGFGFSLTPMGDLDRDGYQELGVSAPFMEVGGKVERGAFFIYELMVQ
ncbi:MAG: integrin alpha [Planctomycetes bacterium]|nr:integrin alpha [Planctomycetota bacterium]